MVVVTRPAKYLGTFVTGLLECLAFAGVIFGWPSLVFVLKEKKYFADLCNATHNSTISPTGMDCSAQDERFSLIFTIATFLLNFMTLPNGIIFDRFGTLVTRLSCITLYTLATLLIAFSTAATDWLLFPAASLIAVGGILFLLSNIQVGNLFGRHKATIITLYHGAFDSSSAVFLLVKVLHELGLSIMSMFLFISCFSVFHLLRTFLLMPRGHIPYPLPENYSYGFCNQNFHSSMPKVDKTNNQDGVHRRSIAEGTEADAGQITLMDKAAAATPQRPRPTFMNCICSWLFLWHFVWLSVMQLRNYLFIGTLNPMLSHLANGDRKQISSYTNAFAFTQLCGIFCAPWNGMIMDWHKRGKKEGEGTAESNSLADLRSSVLSLVLTAVQCVLFSVCATIPILPVQYATFILQVLNRAFLYGGNAAFISLAFPPEHFGKIYGLVMSLSAIVSLLQYPCFSLVGEVLGGDPFYVNIGLLILILLAFIHPVNVYLECRRREKASMKALHTTSAQIGQR